MKKPSEYNSRQIENLENQMWQLLVDALFEMCDEPEDIALTDGNRTYTYISVYDEEDEKSIEISYQELDEEGLYYSYDRNITDLSTDELLKIYKALK